MYLWLIIATFIAALFAMNTSIRSDIKELYVEPQAQTVVTKLYVQHRAAMNYISKRDRNSTVTGLSYKPGELTADMLKADLPYGFRQDSGFNKFTTWVYCLDKDKLENSGAAALPAVCTSGLPPAGGEGGEESNPDLGTGGNCCAGSSTVVYLVTYGCVPSKWRDVRSGKPDGILLGAMKTTTGFTHGMGYAIDRSEFTIRTIPCMRKTSRRKWGFTDRADNFTCRFRIIFRTLPWAAILLPTFAAVRASIMKTMIRTIRRALPICTAAATIVWYTCLGFS